MLIEPYLFYDGRCDEALEFYKKALGAKVEAVMRFKESPDQSMVPPGMGDKVMHACFSIGGNKIMASDGSMTDESPKFGGFSLSISVDNPAEADRVFTALADGGQVQMPLAETFFAKSFGMVADRFGMSWMVIVPQPM